MKASSAYAIVGIGFVIILGALYISPKVATAPSEPKPAAKIAYINASTSDIIVTVPRPGAAVAKTFSVVGEARGYWYFEASFPYSIVDSSGIVLAQGAIQADGEWMTEDFVPFTVNAPVPGSYTGPATLILKKDNPSGEAERDASLSIPIVIQ